MDNQDGSNPSREGQQHERLPRATGSLVHALCAMSLSPYLPLFPSRSVLSHFGWYHTRHYSLEFGQAFMASAERKPITWIWDGARSSRISDEPPSETASVVQNLLHFSILQTVL